MWFASTRWIFFFQFKVHLKEVSLLKTSGLGLENAACCTPYSLLLPFSSLFLLVTYCRFKFCVQPLCLTLSTLSLPFFFFLSIKVWSSTSSGFIILWFKAQFIPLQFYCLLVLFQLSSRLGLYIVFLRLSHLQLRTRVLWCDST